VRRLAILGVVVAAGCDQAFGLVRVDAPVPPACPPPPPQACGVGAPNEDADATADACDLCPQFAGGSANLDSDVDGVGDACDPAPQTPSACRSRFFYGLETSDGWIDPSGWTFDGEAVPNAKTLLVLRSNEAHLSGRATALVFDGGAPGVADSLAGVAILADGDHAYACAINQDRDGAIGSLVLVEISAGADISLARGQVSFAVTPGLAHRVWLELGTDGALECRSSRDANGVVEDVLSINLPKPLVPASVGLVARHSAGYFAYLDFVPF